MKKEKKGPLTIISRVSFNWISEKIYYQSVNLWNDKVVEYESFFVKMNGVIFAFSASSKIEGDGVASIVVEIN